MCVCGRRLGITNEQRRVEKRKNEKRVKQTSRWMTQPFFSLRSFLLPRMRCLAGVRLC